MEKHSIGSWLKALFYDHLMKIWDSHYRQTRYFLIIPCEITEIKYDKIFAGRIVNLSKSGLFIETEKKLSLGSSIYVCFQYKDDNYRLAARVVSDHFVVQSEGIGAKFIYNRFYSNQRSIVANLIRTIEKEHPAVPKS
ncbi:MAG: hypothetical protein A2381_01675 [Bdellovibrionales bacterium RIFOXYB1_FULL_37_110]|nr:MAG: hypothetical protein A2417_15840 [Bdellovibrionales bacterium RIFOXYC1_FULL_37_79]OFZ58925.1 MAG: hypothetical protein A2381_01675 [Bdellovibrionales bacterium RIFOXYB1_FULL_37_110]OFZ64629.1 MAG: hypothetical protein A2577_13260 [Bdellovibrionales bacterium RIFOXYD1_FULL_36_51]